MDELDLLLVDSRHLLWRAASVFLDLHVVNKDGSIKATGGVYGFMRILMATQSRFGGMAIACWDRPEGPTERRKLFSAYKNKPAKPSTAPKKPRALRHKDDQAEADYQAGDRASPALVEREVMMVQMREQEAILKQLLCWIGVRQYSAPGWEADDVIATMSKHMGASSNIGILSGDRDLLQLVTHNVSVIRPQPKGLFEVMTPDKVRKDFGFNPQQVLDFKALSGDNGDNIPGAKGIGPVSATKLIQEHQSWQAALTWATNSTPTSNTAAKLLASRELVEMSAQLATLNSQAPLESIDPKRDIKRALMEIASLKCNTLVSDGRKELLLALAG